MGVFFAGFVPGNLCDPFIKVKVVHVVTWYLAERDGLFKVQGVDKTLQFFGGAVHRVWVVPHTVIGFVLLPCARARRLLVQEPHHAVFRAASQPWCKEAAAARK